MKLFLRAFKIILKKLKVFDCNYNDHVSFFIHIFEAYLFIPSNCFVVILFVQTFQCFLISIFVSYPLMYWFLMLQKTPVFFLLSSLYLLYVPYIKWDYYENNLRNKLISLKLKRGLKRKSRDSANALYESYRLRYHSTYFLTA